MSSLLRDMSLNFLSTQWQPKTLLEPSQWFAVCFPTKASLGMSPSGLLVKWQKHHLAVTCCTSYTSNLPSLTWTVMCCCTRAWKIFCYAGLSLYASILWRWCDVYKILCILSMTSGIARRCMSVHCCSYVLAPGKLECLWSAVQS